MNRFLASLLVLILCSATALAAQQPAIPAQSPAPNGQPVTRIAMLSNGQILRGIVTEDNEKYEIQTAQGSRVVLQANQVDCVCDTLVDAYWHRSARVKASDLEGQVQLFSWCIEHQLLAEADSQLRLLMLTKIKPSRLDYLSRQLSVAHERVAKNIERAKAKANPRQNQIASAPKARQPRQTDQSTASTLTPNMPATPQPMTIDDEYAFSPLPKLPGINTNYSSTALPAFQAFKKIERPATIGFPNQIDQPDVTSQLADSNVDSSPDSAGKIAQVGFEEVIDLPQPKAAPLTKKQLDEETKRMPRKAVATYKRKIEPMLVRSCLAAGCHSTKSKTMPLMSMGPSQLIPRIMSQRNMHEVLGQSDPASPLNSRLLLASVSAHGGAKTPPLKVDTKQFTALANWLIMISNKPNQIHHLPNQFLANPNLPNKAPVSPDAKQAASTKPLTAPIEKPKPARFLTNDAPKLPGLNNMPDPKKESEPIEPGKNPLIDELMDPNVLNDPVYSKLLPDADLNPIPDSTDESDPFDPAEFNRKFGK